MIIAYHSIRGGGGRAVAQSVERATPGEEVPSSIPTVAARSLLVGSVSVCCDRLRQKSWSPSSVLYVAARKIVKRPVLGPVRDIVVLLTRTLRNQPNKTNNHSIILTRSVTAYSRILVLHTCGVRK